jgi:hypothetical protein
MVMPPPSRSPRPGAAAPRWRAAGCPRPTCRWTRSGRRPSPSTAAAAAGSPWPRPAGHRRRPGRPRGGGRRPAQPATCSTWTTRPTTPSATPRRSACPAAGPDAFNHAAEVELLAPPGGQPLPRRLGRFGVPGRRPGPGPGAVDSPHPPPLGYPPDRGPRRRAPRVERARLRARAAGDKAALRVEQGLLDLGRRAVAADPRLGVGAVRRRPWGTPGDVSWSRSPAGHLDGARPLRDLRLRRRHLRPGDLAAVAGPGRRS